MTDTRETSLERAARAFAEASSLGFYNQAFVRTGDLWVFEARAELLTAMRAALEALREPSETVAVAYHHPTWGVVKVCREAGDVVGRGPGGDGRELIFRYKEALLTEGQKEPGQ